MAGLSEVISKFKIFLDDPYAAMETLVPERILYKIDDAADIRRHFRIRMGYWPDLDNPKTFNEKLQWLKLHGRRPEYTMMVDKYAVRSYIAEKLGEEYLIPLLGVWDDPDEIDFDALPDQFVLKCNHNSGLGLCICRDKSKLDISKVKKKLGKGLNRDYYLVGREWPYKDVPRKIIAEKYMVDALTCDKPLDDYKFYCFDGSVKFLMINTDRNTSAGTKADYFDRDFNYLDFKWGYEHADIMPEKPENFEEMIATAEKLSAGIPHVRVDLYNCNGRVYFGEFTFFDGCGFDKFYPNSMDYEFGKLIDLDKVR